MVREIHQGKAAGMMWYCAGCLKAAHMRRKAKKHIETLVGDCADCGLQETLYLKSDYSYHAPRPQPVRVLPDEKPSRQLREWPKEMRFDEPLPSKRGGHRHGAGRPKGTGRYGEPTVPVRVPASRVEEVRALVEAGGRSRPVYLAK